MSEEEEAAFIEGYVAGHIEGEFCGYYSEDVSDSNREEKASKAWWNKS